MGPPTGRGPAPPPWAPVDTAPPPAMARPLALLSLLAAPALLAAPSAVAALSAPVAPAAGAVQDTMREFREEFDKAQKLNSKSRMDELVRTMELEAIRTIVSTAEAISDAPNEVLLTRFEGLREAWKRVHDTEFPDRLERFFARLNAGTKRQRTGLRMKFEELGRNLYQFQQDKNKAAIEAAAQEMAKMADGFAELGDTWLESEALAWAASSLDEGYMGKEAPLDQVATLYGRVLKTREDLGVKDATYKQHSTRYKVLQGLGYGAGAAAPGEGGAAAKARPTGPVSAGPVVTTALAFQELKPLEDLDRPSYYLDEHRQIWPVVGLKGTGSTSQILRVEDGPTVIREGSAKVMLDTDGDGKGDIQWPTKGKYENLVLELGSGDTKRTWALLTEVGRQEDFYQGQPMNLLATDNQYLVYYVPGGYVEGEVSGQKIRIYDDNLDGVYGSPPSRWQHQGLVKDSPQPEFDSIRVGSDKVARPFSEYVELGPAGWHRLTIRNKGTSLEAEPVTLETGTVQIKGKGLKPEFYVLKGVDDTYANTYIDVAGGKKVDVPAGRWELAFGLVRKGNKMQLMKAVILPTEGMERIQVKAGETTEVTYGAPYTFDFQYEVGADKVTVDGASVRIVGAGGESYDRFYNCVPFVDAFVRKTGAKRAAGEASLKPAVDNLGLERHGWAGMWKPVIAEPLDKVGDEVEVQLVEKKNKLFGKVESDWK